MKQPQDRKQKNINKKDFPFLSEIEELQKNKSIDDIAELIIKLLGLYSLDMKEVSALMYYVMQATIKEPINAKLLQERMNLEVSTLSVQGILKIQEALVNIYVEELVANNKRP